MPGNTLPSPTTTKLPPGGGFAAIGNPNQGGGMTLAQAIQHAKANPTSGFASTLGKFIQNGDADTQAMHEGVDLSFAGRPALKDMYTAHLNKNGITPPPESTLESLQNGFHDLINKAGDNTVQQQEEGGQKMLSSVEEGAAKHEAANGDVVKEGLSNVETGLGTASGAVQSIFAPVTGIIQAISDKASDTKVVQDFANGAGPLVDLYGQLEDKVAEISKAHPEAAKNISDAANVLLATMGGETGAAKTDIGAGQDAIVKAAGDAKDAITKPGEAPAPIPEKPVEPTKEPIAGAAENGTAQPGKVAAAIDKVAKGAPLTAKSIFSKVYRISPESSDTLIQYAHDHPEIDLHDALAQQNMHNLGKEVESEIAKKKTEIPSVADITDQVKSGIDKKMHALNEHAKQYNTLGNDAKPGAPRKAVKVDPNWLKAQFGKLGIKLGQDGRIASIDKTSPVALSKTPTAASRLQALWDDWNEAFNKGKMSQHDWLNFRSTLGDIANYKGGVDLPLEKVAHGIRETLNKEHRPQIPGLEKIDAEHAKMSKDLEDSLTGIATIDKTEGLPKVKMNEGAMSNIMNADKETRAQFAARLEKIVPGITKKINDTNAFGDEWKGIVDDSGNLRENALMNIKGSLNAGRDLRLEKLENLMPGITDKLKLIHAADEYHNAMKGLPGMYVGASAMSQIFTGNPVLGIAGAIATQPNVGLKILQTIGRAGKGVKKP